MTKKSRTALFKTLAAQAEAEYSNPKWPFAKKWLRRVGLPRLHSEAAAIEANGLLDSIHAGIHRNEPELESLLHDARKAAHEYSAALLRDNWRRFEGRPKE